MIFYMGFFYSFFSIHCFQAFVFLFFPIVDSDNHDHDKIDLHKKYVCVFVYIHTYKYMFVCICDLLLSVNFTFYQILLSYGSRKLLTIVRVGSYTVFVLALYCYNIFLYLLKVIYGTWKISDIYFSVGFISLFYIRGVVTSLLL